MLTQCCDPVPSRMWHGVSHSSPLWVAIYASGNLQNTIFTFYILFWTILNYSYYSYLFHYLLTTKSQNSHHSQKSTRAALLFWTIVTWHRVTIVWNGSVAPSCHRHHWHPHCTSWRTCPSPPCSCHHCQQADPSISATVTCVSSLSSLVRCCSGTGHSCHLHVFIPIVVTVMLLWHWPFASCCCCCCCGTIIITVAIVVVTGMPHHHGTGHPCDFVVNDAVVLAVDGQLMLVVVMGWHVMVACGCHWCWW